MPNQTSNPAVIHSYTAAQALLDGVFINPAARMDEDLPSQYGFKVPILVTNGVWADLVAVPKAADYQSEKGRLWDILTMLRFTLPAACRRGLARFIFPVSATHTSSDTWEPEDHKLLAAWGEDPDIGTHIVVMWPSER